MDGWVVIPNWEKFQHYKDRDPNWIKNYRDLLHNDHYLKLTGHQRGVLHGLWMIYAAGDGQVSSSTSEISRQLGLRVTTPTLESLNDAGFLAFSASRPLALARSRARASREKRREEKKEGANAQKQTRPNMPATDTETNVRALIHNGVITDVFELADYDLPDTIRDELVDLVLNGRP